MGNPIEAPSLSADEEASLLADLTLEIQSAMLRSPLDFKSDGDKIVFARTALVTTPSEMAKLFRLPEVYFRIPQERKIPEIQNNPVLKNRFAQMIGIACFLNRVIKDPFSRDDFLRTDRGIFATRSPLQTLIEMDALPAFSIIKAPAKQWGAMYSERGPRRAFV
jgi:hypothetical protein